MEVTMYDKLLLLPLFQGLGKEDLTSILEKVKIHFHKFPSGSYLVQQERTCKELIFILQGTVRSEATDKQYNYTLYENIDSPCILEAYSLFGMHTQYNASYQALTDVHTISIDKNYVLSELNNYEVFRLNMLNMLSNRAQTVHYRMWHTHIGNTKEKVINFIQLRCSLSGGEKQLRIRMEDLAELIDDTRINVSKALNELKDHNLVVLGRKAIEIPDMEALINHIK